ncbi:hypothetical protein F2Q70_00029994 [Brassica cretica]|uniref:Uncharacterized protein n=1 Tax=Brassica cretica TaxID=69181 RepID=A0A8S9FNS7_BRACR|nr:hypothetical protein F2Q70_00029994 [Brassica cretica]
MGSPGPHQREPWARSLDPTRFQEMENFRQGETFHISEYARETTENPELSSEVQRLKEKLGEHSKQLDLSSEKLNQLQKENAALRDQNKAPNMASNKKRRFNTRVQPMGTLRTPNTGEGTTNATPASRAARATREGIEDHQIHDLEEKRSSQKGSKDSGSRNLGRFQYRPLEKEEGMSVSTWPDITHLSISTPELVNTLRQMGQHVKWTPKMKAPDSFWNPGLWCDLHRDHGHKTEDRGKFKGNAPSSPPLQDRVIHVISGGSEVSGVSHAAAKKSTRNAKHGLETAQPKCLLLGTDEISFTAKEKEKILALNHDALVVSLTIANCLVKRILADNGSSSNIIFLTAYQDLGLEENTLTCKVTPLIGGRPRSYSNYRGDFRSRGIGNQGSTIGAIHEPSA